MKQNDFYEVDGCTVFIPVKIIEEHKHMTNTLEVELTETGHRTVVPHIYSFPKVNEHQKPVVPKFVADWVDDSREYSLDFDEWLDYENQPTKVYHWLNQENKRQAELNVLALITLIVNGANAVEIEQEKLYTVEIPEAILTKITRGRNVQYKMLLSRDVSEFFNNPIYYITRLTEKEIKEADERLWQFAKEVE